MPPESISTLNSKIHCNWCKIHGKITELDGIRFADYPDVCLDCIAEVRRRARRSDAAIKAAKTRAMQKKFPKWALRG